MKNMNSVISFLILWIPVIAFSGCHSMDEDENGSTGDTLNQLPTGEYVSADVEVEVSDFDLTGRDTSDGGLSEIGTAGGPEPIAPENRIVLEPGNVRLSEDGDTLFVNRAPRGLQVIDISNPEAPGLLMERRFTWDTPSMYLHGNRLVVVAYDTPDIGADQMRVIVFDVGNPARIVELSDTVIDGQMSSTALIGGDGTFILYVMLQRGTDRVLESYAIDAEGGVIFRDTIRDAECDRNNLWASESHLLISRTRYVDGDNDDSEVESITLTPIDISTGDGVMTTGEPIRFPGGSIDTENIGISGHILTVSGAAYDITDVTAATLADWDDPEDRYETLFTEGTRDISISVSDSGLVLVGGVELGMDNQSNFVRMYDLSDPSEIPSAIAQVNLEDLEFSFLSSRVAENAVEVTAPDGTLETGLYGIPFWDSTSQATGLQLVTFSASTLTLRGRISTMDKNYFWLPPRDGQVVGVSGDDVVLFDISDVTTPVLQSRTVIAPTYTDFAVFGETGFRLEVSDSFSGGGYVPAGPRAELQTIPVSEAPGNVNPSVRLETNAIQLYQVGDHLLVGVNDIDMTSVDVFDVTDPAQPVLASRVDGSEGGIDTYARFAPQSTDNALIFTNTQYHRGGESAVFMVLDLRRPDTPVFQPALTMPEDELVQHLFVRGTTLYYCYKQPYEVEGDVRTYAKYFYKRIELADPATPMVSDGISIPGMLIDADGDFVYTRDEAYGEGGIRAVINQLHVKDGVAVVKNQTDLGNRRVLESRLLENGYLLVNHRSASATQEISEYRLSLLNVHDGLQIEGDVAYRRFGELVAASSNHAVLRVGNGVIVMDLSTPAAPTKSHYFPLCGNFFFQAMIDGDTLYVVQGGIYRFEL